MTTRKALSAFLAFTRLITSVLVASPLGASAESANRVTAQTDAILEVLSGTSDAAIVDLTLAKALIKQ